MKTTMKVLVLIVSAYALTGCSKVGLSSSESNTGGQSMEDSYLKLASTQSESSGSASPAANAQPGDYVRLKSIDFGQGGYIIPVYGVTAPATPSSTVIGGDSFAYTLDLSSGVVLESGTGTVVYTLTSDDRVNFRNIISGSVIATYRDLRGDAAGIACPPTVFAPYARLVTSGGDFLLSNLSACDIDLFKIATLERSGLEQYLADLETKIQMPTPPGQLALGLYPLDQISSLSFQHVGGFIAPGYSPPSITVNLPECPSNPALGVPCKLATVVLNDGCNIQRQLSDPELANLKSNLIAAYLGYDMTNMHIIDAGEDRLTLNFNFAQTTYSFIGGDDSHSSKVIFGESLRRQIQDFSSSLQTMACTWVKPVTN